MRPRVFPAEDLSDITVVVSSNIRFNEAAGIPRGRPYEGEPNDGDGSLLQ